MRIIRRAEATHISKQQSVEVEYYLFDDYEVHYNEQLPHTSQPWHHHDTIRETIYVIDGELTAYWREDDKEQSAVLHAGDLIETGNTSHTFANESDHDVRFMVFKRVPLGANYRELFKSDKIMD